MTDDSLYLGDGAYARWDGVYVWVETDRGGITHRVALDAPALVRLVEFVVRGDPMLGRLLRDAAGGAS